MRKVISPEERFWPKVDKRKTYSKKLKSYCWVWTAAKNDSNHGIFVYTSKKPSRTKRAHVFSWELENGVVPAGKELHHKCENPICVRPSHLVALTRAEHMQQHLRNTCPQGHKWTKENTRINKKTNARICRECHRQRERIRQQLMRKGKRQH